MDFSKKGSQSIKVSSSSIDTNSFSSAASSIVSCNASSIISSDSAYGPDSYNLSFITDNKNCYDQLLEELSIIDETQNSFYDPNSGQYDKQLIDTERQISLKRKCLDAISESELCYINDFQKFESFGNHLKKWLHDKRDKEIYSKFLLSPAKSDLDTLLSILKQISTVHALFLSDLKKRLSVWGPTQIISDLFDGLQSRLTIYSQFMENHPKFVLLLDALYKLPAFEKFMNSTLNITSDQKIMDGLLHYLHIPLHRLDFYIDTLKYIMRYSDRSHPDYYNVSLVSDKFKSLEKRWSAKVHSGQSHLMALESFLSIEDCPVQITLDLRLLLFAQLVKIDMDDITLTSDVRMYFLFNDYLIFCKKPKERKGGPEKKMECKGIISLSGATLRLLSNEFLTKMCEVKKPLFRIGKKSAESNLTNTEAFGFELVTSELVINGISSHQQDFQGSLSSNISVIKRRHPIRTRSLKEQNLWVEAISKAIRAIKPSTT